MTSHALPKSSLLKKSREYNRVYGKGKRLHGEEFSLIILPNQGTENRLGISIHGRLKGSVKRNRIKRIIKEFYRLNRNFIPPAHDVVFTVRKGFQPGRPAEIALAVNALLRKRNRR